MSRIEPRTLKGFRDYPPKLLIPREPMLEGRGANGLTRPLCPYPQWAEYAGKGDLKDGRNWSCKGAAPKGKP